MCAKHNVMGVCVGGGGGGGFTHARTYTCPTMAIERRMANYNKLHLNKCRPPGILLVLFKTTTISSPFIVCSKSDLNLEHTNL